ncbi:hemin uptake protein HemP [Marinomonas sp. MED121]|uniref:hemin uptake protein HemP n=1 Tax=Marinomonas sp. MED121 TaxID=314277 RepID=UPI0009FF6B37|nr:hemin uptake protein HemP [Marinomonas sp. MED121]
MSSIKTTLNDITVCVSTEKLMQGKNELTIIHNEQHYTLRITRNGKLILTK